MADANPMPTTGPIQASTSAANNIVQQHPWMATQSPEITADLIHSGASPDQVDLVDHTSRGVAIGNAITQHQTDHNSHSIWSDALGGVTNLASGVVHALGHVVPGFSTVAGWANKGLQEVQKDFKFIGGVYKDRGIGEGLLATAGVVAGGVLGSLAGPEGTVFGATLGADLAGMGERQILGRVIPAWQQPYKQSNDPKFIMNPGHVVADVLSKVPGLKSLADTNHGWGQTVSGLTDMGFDFSLDPLVGLGKLSGAMKSGGFVKGVAQEGKQVGVVFTSKLANAAPAVGEFLQKNTGVAFNSEGVQMVFENGKNIANAGLLGKVGNTFNPFTSSARNFYRAVNTIAEESNPVAIQAMFPASRISNKVAQDLAKATESKDVVNILGDSLYTREVGANGDLQGLSNRLVLPTQTVARAWYGKGIDHMLQKAGDPTLDETRNLILPKKVAVKDADGNFLDAEGNNVAESGKPKTYQNLYGGLFTKSADGQYQIWNAAAGKVRTFTGYRALSLNKTLMEQSSKTLSFDDPQLGVTIYNMARYAMGRQAALEVSSNIMKHVGVDDAQFNIAYSNLTKEIAKAAGVSNDENLVRNVMSQIQRAHISGPNELKSYGQTVGGNNMPGTEMRDTLDETGKSIPQDPQQVALWESQLGSAAIMDFKQLRKSIQEANAYNRIYQKADDFFTWYTEKAFAPLTLFTTGFGIRVAMGEALHQVLRNGPKDYLQNVIASSALRYDKDIATNSQIKKALDDFKKNRLAESITKEDHAAMAGKNNGIVKENEVTKHINEKTELWDKLHLPRPVGFISSKIAPYVAADKVAIVHDFQQTYGIILPEAAAANHLAKASSAAESEVGTLAQLLRKPVKGGKDPLALFDYTHPSYHGGWATQLNDISKSTFGKDIANDYLALSKNKSFTNLNTDKQWQKIKELHTERLKTMPAEYKALQGRMIGLRWGKPESFASNQVEAMRSLVEGQDKTIHADLINNIANGKSVTADTLRDKLPESGPLKVIGRVRPDSSSMFNKVIEAGHRTMISPIIDHVSREPIFNHYLYENYRAYKPAIDAGVLDHETALRLSGQTAVQDMLPLIHNPALRSQMAMMHRNLLPFYFAQEQAIKRVGRLILTNPAAARDFQMINQGMNNPGFVHTDPSGQQYIVYPVIGHFGEAVARGMDALGFKQYVGLPMSITGSTQSLLSVLPEAKMPSVNPFANVAVTDLAQRFPNFMGLSKVADRVANLSTGANPFDPNSSGHLSTSMLDTMIPNSSIRDLFNALHPDQRESMIQSSMQSAIASAFMSGQLDKQEFAQMTPSEQQAVLDKIQHNAQTNLLVKGLLAFFLPLSPNVTNDHYTKNLQTFRSEFLQMVQEETAKKTPNAFGAAQQRFMEEHGDNALSYTVSRTVSGSGGSSMPLSDAVLKYIDNNKGLFDSHPYAAAYLVPQTDSSPDALKVEKQLLAMNLRQKRTPKEFLDAIYVSKGWSDLQPSLDKYHSLMDAAQKAGNRPLIGQLAGAWKQFTQTYGLQNPIWYADYQNPTKTTSANQALAQLQDLNKNGKLGNSNVAPGIKSLLASYDNLHAALQSTMYMNGQRHTPQYSAYINAWTDYLNNLKISNPELTNVISGVFKRVV